MGHAGHAGHARKRSNRARVGARHHAPRAGSVEGTPTVAVDGGDGVAAADHLLPRAGRCAGPCTRPCGRAHARANGDVPSAHVSSLGGLTGPGASGGGGGIGLPSRASTRAAAPGAGCHKRAQTVALRVTCRRHCAPCTFTTVLCNKDLFHKVCGVIFPGSLGCLTEREGTRRLWEGFVCLYMGCSGGLS